MKNVLKNIRGSIMIGIAFILVMFYLFAIDFIIRQYSEFELILRLDWQYYILISLYLFFVLVLAKIFGGFKIGHYRVTEIIYFQILAVILANIMITFLFLLLFQGVYNVLPILIITLIEVFFIIAWAYFGNRIYMQLNKPLRMLLIYEGEPKPLIEKMSSRYDRYNICKIIHQSEGIDELKKECLKYRGVILYAIDENLKSALFQLAFENDMPVYIIPSISDILSCNMEKSDLFDTPIFFSRNMGLSTEQRIFKRVLDLSIILPATFLTLPFMLITAISIKLYDRGPVLYKQLRLTKNGKSFFLYKFRSMRVDAESVNGAQLATKNDSRITPLGKVIRAIRFDELPQVINIIKGDMSIVGPRPERPEIAGIYEKTFPEFKYRLKVKAGLTGYAQVFGKYNTTPIDKVKLDLIYIQNYSLLLDFKLILMTLKVLFMSESTQGIDEGETLAIYSQNGKREGERNDKE